MGDLERLVHAIVDEGLVPGAIGVLGRADADPEIVCAGLADVDGPALQADAILRIQSMTKAIEAAATWQLVEAGRLRLDDPVEAWLPELAGRHVLVHSDAELDDTEPAERTITVADLLACTSGYGMMTSDSPLARAMAASRTDAGPDPVSLGADDWVAALGALPAAFQAGRGWRYHHSYGLLGVLLSRLVGRPLGDQLAEALFVPLGMTDTGFWVPDDQARRLPAAFRREDGQLVQVEPAGGGWYAGRPPFDVSHAELVSTAADYAAFLRMLGRGGVTDDGRRLLSSEAVRQMRSDHVPDEAKASDSFFIPGFFDGVGWGHGGSVDLTGHHAGRYGWSGGLGTMFRLDADGSHGLLLTQVEFGPETFGLFGRFGEVRAG